MKDEIQKILKIVVGEQKLNARRYPELKDEIQKILKIVVGEQKLNAQRYSELKSSTDVINLTICDINANLATKDQLNQVFESLSQDISAVTIDNEKLKKRTDSHEKRIKKLETKVLLS